MIDIYSERQGIQSGAKIMIWTTDANAIVSRYLINTAVYLHSVDTIIETFN